MLGVNVVVLDEQRRVLLIQREDFEVWCTPGGLMEKAASIEPWPPVMSFDVSSKALRLAISKEDIHSVMSSCVSACRRMVVSFVLTSKQKRRSS